MLNKLKILFTTTLFSTMGASYASSQSRNAKLIDRLVQHGIIKSQEVAAVMKSVDRGDYTSNDPYNDTPQSIGYRATISAPHMHAVALEYLKDHLKNGTKALDVGSGSGYLTVCFSKMMGKPGSVAYGIEHIPELVKTSIENIKHSDSNLLETGKVVIIEGDGRMGKKEFSPFDAIHVGAAAREVPKALLEQLANGGRMLIPVGTSNGQDFLIIDKDKDGKISKMKALDVIYVPLTDKEKQWPPHY